MKDVFVIRYGQMLCFCKNTENVLLFADSKFLMDYVRDREVVTFDTLLARNFSGKWARANGISQIWYLVAHGF